MQSVLAQMRLFSFCSRALLCLLISGAPRVRAEDVLEIPGECGSQIELTREIAALRAASRSAISAQRPAVRLTREGDGYMLTVALRDGRRTLRDPDCRALFRAAIVIAALGHESSVENVLETSEAGPTPAPDGEEARAEEATANLERTRAAAASEMKNVSARDDPEKRALASRGQAQARDERDARRRVIDDAITYPRKLSARALLRAELAYGIVPELSALFGLGVALEYAHFSGRAVFAYQGPPRKHASGAEGVQVDALSASLTLEWVALPWLRPGIGIDFAALHGRGVGVRSPKSAWATQPMPHAGLSLRMLRRGPFWLELSVRALWAPEPARFLIRGRAAVYSASPWAVQGGISAGYQFL